MSQQTGSLYKRRERRPDGTVGLSRKWHGAYFDPALGRRVSGVLYTDKAASDAELRRRIRLAERRAAGIEDPELEALKRPLLGHVEDYLREACGRQDRLHVHNKRAVLGRFCAAASARSLADLTPERLHGFLLAGEAGGLSARTWNYRRQVVLSFANWLQRARRIPAHRLVEVPRAAEGRDRRVRRRVLTGDELGALLSAAPPQRRLAYLLAAWTGLRRKELARLRWRHLDLAAGVARLDGSVTKAGEDQAVPLHPQLVAELAAVRAASAPGRAGPQDRVLPAVPRCETVERDFERAGIGYRDAAGAIGGLHALRRTLYCRVEDAGVPSERARVITRHASALVAERHYARARLEQAGRDLAALPAIEIREAPARAPLRATGTDGAPAPGPGEAAGRSASAARRRRSVSERGGSRPGHAGPAGLTAGAQPATMAELETSGAAGGASRTGSGDPRAFSSVGSAAEPRQALDPGGTYDSERASAAAHPQRAAGADGVPDSFGPATLAQVQLVWDRLAWPDRATIGHLIRPHLRDALCDARPPSG